MVIKRCSSAILLSVLVFCSVAYAQDNLRLQLFNEADGLLKSAKEKQAELYAPVSFERAMQYYRDASEYFTKGAKLEDIREKVKNASAYLAKALDACKLGEETFTATMSARSDAMTAGAPKSTGELWDKAEERFRRAARDLEDGSVGDARKEGDDATKLYRSAELEAIKTNYLSPARDLLKKAEEMRVKDRAPRTFARAQSLVAQVGTLLNQNRYDTDSARQLAMDAKYEAAHAIYLSLVISKMRQEDKTFEDNILDDENQFLKIAAKLGIEARFDSGFDIAASNILRAMNEKDAKGANVQEGLLRATDSLHQMGLTLIEKDNQIENFKLQIASMEHRLGSLTENEQQLKQSGEVLQQKLNTQREYEQKVKSLSAMFSEEEGNVLRDGDDIIIRLYGLTFPVGKNTIEPQYYSLLTKVQDAIKKFPQCQVMIEGHTDSQGSDEVNQTLSQSRAKAVAEYLMANMGVEIPVHSQGFGESRPIASNDTPEGRAKNRRIEVVITPNLGDGK